MPFLIQLGAQLLCPHGGTVAITPQGNPRVLLSGQLAATAADLFSIAGCPNSPPCQSVIVQGGAIRVSINGQPAVLASGGGICVSAAQVPQGPVVVASTQTRVSGV